MNVQNVDKSRFHRRDLKPQSARRRFLLNSLHYITTISPGLDIYSFPSLFKFYVGAECELSQAH